MRTAIFTIDTESYEAKKKSAAGEALKRMLEQNRLEVKAAKVLPRDKEVVATVFRQLADSGSVELIITTGATGYLEQDCAPKAVEEVAEQLIPGIPEALRAYNLKVFQESNARLYGGRHSEKYTYCESAGKCKNSERRYGIHFIGSSTSSGEY